MNNTMLSKCSNKGAEMLKTSRGGHKQLLRSRCNEKYAALTDEYMAEANTAMAAKIFDLPEYVSASTVFCYMSMPREAGTDEIIERALADGKRVCIPLCVDKCIMEAREYKAGDGLAEGAYGIREPLESAPLVEPQEIDFAVIPCVTCDREGNRLGHGAGYYDRFMSEGTFTRAALCYDKILATNVPVIDTDIPMNMVVTESEVYVRDEDPKNYLRRY